MSEVNREIIFGFWRGERILRSGAEIVLGRTLEGLGTTLWFTDTRTGNDAPGTLAVINHRDQSLPSLVDIERIKGGVSQFLPEVVPDPSFISFKGELPLAAARLMCPLLIEANQPGLVV